METIYEQQGRGSAGVLHILTGHHDTSVRILYSYGTPVAVFGRGIFVRTAKRHSQTTTKHINAFEREVEAGIRTRETVGEAVLQLTIQSCMNRASADLTLKPVKTDTEKDDSLTSLHL